MERPRQGQRKQIRLNGLPYQRPQNAWLEQLKCISSRSRGWKPKVKMRPGRFHPEVSSCRWLLSHCVPPWSLLGACMCMGVKRGGRGGGGREGGRERGVSGPDYWTRASPSPPIQPPWALGLNIGLLGAQFSLLQSEGQRKGKVGGEGEMGVGVGVEGRACGPGGGAVKTPGSLPALMPPSLRP